VKRHNHEHGEGAFEGSSREYIDDLDDEDVSRQSSQRDSHVARTKLPSKHHSAYVITDTSYRSTRCSIENSDTGRSSLYTQNKVAARAGTSHAAHAASSHLYVLKPRDIRMQRWAELLQTRPDTMDETGMSVWIDEVMSVSNLKKPLGLKPNAPFPFSSREDDKSKPLKKRKRADTKATKEDSDARHSKKPSTKETPQTASPLKSPTAQTTSLPKPSQNPDTRQVPSDMSKNEMSSSKSGSDARMSAPEKKGAAASSLNS
jgi:hypothetical protein